MSFGWNFTIHTDHSPLVNVFKKCLNDTCHQDSQCLLLLLLRLKAWNKSVPMPMSKYVTKPVKNVPIAWIGLSMSLQSEVQLIDGVFQLHLWLKRLDQRGSHIRTANSWSWNSQWCQSRLVPWSGNRQCKIEHLLNWLQWSRKVGQRVNWNCLMKSNPTSNIDLSYILWMVSLQWRVRISNTPHA